MEELGLDSSITLNYTCVNYTKLFYPLVYQSSVHNPSIVLLSTHPSLQFLPLSENLCVRHSVASMDAERKCYVVEWSLLLRALSEGRPLRSHVQVCRKEDWDQNTLNGYKYRPGWKSPFLCAIPKVEWSLVFDLD